jgi:hypothetical protein
MALITRTCTSRGAAVIFTIDDVTLRTTQVQWIVVSNALRIVIFDELGEIAHEINTGQATSPDPLNVPVRLVEITKSDLTIKSYICPRFAVYF